MHFDFEIGEISLPDRVLRGSLVDQLPRSVTYGIGCLRTAAQLFAQRRGMASFPIFAKGGRRLAVEARSEECGGGPGRNRTGINGFAVRWLSHSPTGPRRDGDHSSRPICGYRDARALPARLPRWRRRRSAAFRDRGRGPDARRPRVSVGHLRGERARLFRDRRARHLVPGAQRDGSRNPGLLDPRRTRRFHDLLEFRTRDARDCWKKRAGARPSAMPRVPSSCAWSPSRSASQPAAPADLEIGQCVQRTRETQHDTRTLLLDAEQQLRLRRCGESVRGVRAGADRASPCRAARSRRAPSAQRRRLETLLGAVAERDAAGLRGRRCARRSRTPRHPAGRESARSSRRTFPRRAGSGCRVRARRAAAGSGSVRPRGAGHRRGEGTSPSERSGGGPAWLTPPAAAPRRPSRRAGRGTHRAGRSGSRARRVRSRDRSDRPTSRSTRRRTRRGYADRSRCRSGRSARRAASRRRGGWADPRPRSRVVSGGLGRHRSHSPPIMLRKSKVGIRSASMPPRSIFGIGCRLMKLGGRQRTFHGCAVPSDTT